MLSRLPSLAAFLFCVFAALTAIRLAVAETVARRNNAESLRLAIAMQGAAPSAQLMERLAEEDPAHARGILKHLVLDVNPRSSAAWIQLGMLEEREGDPRVAERYLLDAADVDHQYLPAWTLANFYFRQGRPDDFWPWADRAASLIYDEFPPLLQLCDKLEPNPDRLLAHFRDERPLRPPYLKYLIGGNRLADAQWVAREMTGDRANDPLLIDLADRQARAGNAAEAVALWNVSSGLNRIDPLQDKLLTNGDLVRAPLNLGFDWRLSQTKGVRSIWKPSELIFEFSGSQSENCSLLEQTILLTPRRFRLRFDYLTGGAASGIHWSLVDAKGDNSEGPMLEPSETWREGAYDLPRTKGLANLKLLYRREPGSTRIEGHIEMRHLRLEPLRQEKE